MEELVWWDIPGAPATWDARGSVEVKSVVVVAVVCVCVAPMLVRLWLLKNILWKSCFLQNSNLTQTQEGLKLKNGHRDIISSGENSDMYFAKTKISKHRLEYMRAASLTAQPFHIA